LQIEKPVRDLGADHVLPFLFAVKFFCMVLSFGIDGSFRRFELDQEVFTGGEMSLSAKHRSQSNNASHSSNHPSSDSPESSENRNISTENASQTGDNSLIEHVLDFLDSYPACFASQIALTESVFQL